MYVFTYLEKTLNRKLHVCQPCLFFLFSQAHIPVCKLSQTETCNRSFGAGAGLAVPDHLTATDPVIHESWAKVTTSEGCFNGVTDRTKEQEKEDPVQ